MDDEIFIVSGTWQAVKLNSIDIQDGIYALFNRGNNHIEVSRSDAAPTGNNGATTMNTRGDSVKYELTGSQKIFVRTPNTRAEIGVVSAG